MLQQKFGGAASTWQLLAAIFNIACTPLGGGGAATVPLMLEVRESGYILALAILPEGRTQPITLASAQIGHILLSISAYAALMTAALQSILIGVQERRLRSPQTGLLGVLPPMESMENLFISVLWLGLGLLTLSIATVSYTHLTLPTKA